MQVTLPAEDFALAYLFERILIVTGRPAAKTTTGMNLLDSLSVMPLENLPPTSEANSSTPG
jgi:hypothetical protein